MGLPRRASQLPLTAISLGLQAWERSRGLREFALRRTNEALQIAAHTPLGRLLPQQVFDDRAEEEAALIVADARGETVTTTRTEAPARPTPTPTPTPTPAKVAATPPTATPPAAPQHHEPSEAAKEVGAPGAVTAEVDEITEHLHMDTPESRDDLPIPDFDNISIGSLRARLRSLSVEQLVVLREWEQEHAHRLQVITTLDNRIAKLADSDDDTSKQSAAPNPAPGGVGGRGTDYPREAVDAERTAEQQGGTLRI